MAIYQYIVQDRQQRLIPNFFMTRKYYGSIQVARIDWDGAQYRVVGRYCRSRIEDPSLIRAVLRTYNQAPKEHPEDG
jgi:hypothetical protein